MHQQQQDQQSTKARRIDAGIGSSFAFIPVY